MKSYANLIKAPSILSVAHSFLGEEGPRGAPLIGMPLSITLLARGLLTSVSLVAILSLSLSCVAMSGALAAGTTGADFLTMGSGARIEAMAGSGTALAVGQDAVYWNPASLGRSGGSSLCFSHAAWFADISYEHIVYVCPLKPAVTMALSSSILHTQGIPRTSEDPYGLYKGTDGSFAYTAMVVSASLGKYVGEGFYVGGSAKILYEDNEAEASTGMAFDMAGVYVSPDGRWSLGVASRNIGRGLEVHDITQPLPSTLSIGFATALLDSTLIASVDACATADAGTRFSWGIEQRMRQTLFLRAGYTSSTEPTAHRGLTVGVGISVRGISLDYSATDYQSLGLVHRFTLGIGG